MTVLFYKVQNRPDYLAYVGERREDEKQVGRITKIKVEGEDAGWQVDLDALEAPRFFTSAQAAKAFVSGFFLGRRHAAAG